MENTGFELDAEKGSVELSAVKINSHNSKPPQHVLTCQPDICRSMHAQYLQNKSKMAASPWDGLKTRFLIGIIGLLCVWALLYITSSNLGLV